MSYAIGRVLQRGRCPECGSNEWITDPEIGEIICRRCGLVRQEQILSQKPEWRAFNPEEQRAKSRVGSPSSLSHYDKGLSTTFRPNEKLKGALPPKTSLKMRRLKRWDTRTKMQSSAAHNLFQAMAELDRLADKLHVPKTVKEEAALIYRRALNEGLVRGRSIAAIAAASLYAACRMTRNPRRLKDIVEASTRGRKDVARCYRLIQRELGLRMPIDDPTKYVAKIASRAGINQMAQNTAIDLIRRARRGNVIAGKGPAGIAAAALYIASVQSGKKVTQKNLAEASGVTEVTVRNSCRELEKSLGLRIRISKKKKGKHTRPSKSAK